MNCDEQWGRAMVIVMPIDHVGCECSEGKMVRGKQGQRKMLIGWRPA